MKILERMDKLHCDIYKDPLGTGRQTAERLQGEAVVAIHNGIGSAAWTTYMSNFADNQIQLNRLKGAEPAYMALLWGPKTLAYLVANSTCGINTFTGTKNNMTQQMFESLDLNIDPTPDGTIPHP